jgi:hypothetical protein
VTSRSSRCEYTLRRQYSSNQEAIFRIRNDSPTGAVIDRMAARAHPPSRHLARRLPSIPARPSQTLRSFEQAVATDLAVVHHKSLSGSHVGCARVKDVRGKEEYMLRRFPVLIVVVALLLVGVLRGGPAPHPDRIHINVTNRM